jgi:hypothetical protein
LTHTDILTAQLDKQIDTLVRLIRQPLMGDCITTAAQLDSPACTMSELGTELAETGIFIQNRPDLLFPRASAVRSRKVMAGILSDKFT